MLGCASGPGPAPTECDGGPREWSLVTDEIDAAAALTFDDSRAEIYRAVAGRPGLTPGEQAHLVCTALRTLSFDSTREDVLLRLVENPEFAPRAKACILRNLNRFSFDDARVRLLHAMQGKGEPPPPPRLEEGEGFEPAPPAP
jgi:hypothetical protein